MYNVLQLLDKWNPHGTPEKGTTWRMFHLSGDIYKETLSKGPVNLVPVSESSTYQGLTYRASTVL